MAASTLIFERTELRSLGILSPTTTSTPRPRSVSTLRIRTWVLNCRFTSSTAAERGSGSSTRVRLVCSSAGALPVLPGRIPRSTSSASVSSARPGTVPAL
ncbi:MAG: hypothetical protein AVDCRST_MAG29-1689 [uncultured Nocardioidaceae bacterium]|uniref:Uncharacterized protein n=1 Tax=uncultured Nocardioidaceae bacterium TaxID=253824 RepID=A0A6J4LWL7_9ACTN|nr:MAG: hypothetical protein AVDCRST_MAG29-1689 [uncultured Nocardioidaceae bacterium]